MAITYAVRNVMTEDIVSVKTTDSLSKAVRLMVENNIGSVVVFRGEDAVGILTERDVLKKFCYDEQCAVLKTEDVMSSPPVTIETQAALGRAADLMAEKKVRRLLVKEGEKVIGIVTERDIMRATLYVFKTLSDAAI